MAISSRRSSTLKGKTPLLNHTVEGVVDYQGRPARRSKSGGWRSAGFIIGAEITERFAYFGISFNLINYLTGPLGQSTATAAENVNAWTGTSLLLPLLGAFVADSYLGRYRTIFVASLLYILGLGLLFLSAILTSHCQSNVKIVSCTLPELQVIFFFFSLYLVAIAQGGHRPCVQALGADQFDDQNPEECKAKSSFFNWWYFGTCACLFVTNFLISYIQENFSWGLGFGIPCVVMVVALIVFLLGSTTYRYSNAQLRSPFRRIGRVFVAAFRNWRAIPSTIVTEEESHGILPHQGFEQFKFLDKALLTPCGSKEEGRVCKIVEVEEAKAVLRLVPMWGTCLVYSIVCVQSSTFFTVQGATMERTIMPGLVVPAASLQSFISFTIVLIIPFYDRVFVPIARGFTGKPSGITVLQRIGTGMFLSVVSMAVAAVIEIKRLKTAQEYDLVDTPNSTVPMSLWWLVPQYLMFGVADAFTMVGLQEFFYDQMPNDLRSIGLALYLSIFGVGGFLSSFLVSAIEEATGGTGHDSWFSDNLNRAHLDYFYWLLAGLGAIGLTCYIYFARSYIYNRRDRM